MDNLQYAELFLTESRENVSAVNTALLELERDTVGPGASAAVDTIFRAVHTIKGMCATMGYAIVAEAGARARDVLDRIRRTDLLIDADIMDVLFHAADVLESAVEAAVAGRDGEVVAEELVAHLRDLGATGGEISVEWTAASPSGDGTLVRVRLAPNTPLRGVRAFIVVQSLRKIGEIVGVEPPLEDLQADRFDDDFAVRVVTTSLVAEIERVARAAGDVIEVQVGEDVFEDPAMRRTSQFIIPSAMVASELAAPTAVAPRVSGPTKAPLAARSVRIDVRRLDALMNLIGELVIARGRLTQLAGQLGDTSLDETVSQSSQLITELRNEITASRMVPVSHVFDRFPRVVRDAAKGVGKEVEFVVEGKDIELDRSMLDELGDSIVHLLRNAIDHGIEQPDVRTAAGKPSAGRLVLSAARQRSAIVMKVSDDGRGIDRTRVLERAKRDGFVEASKADLNEEELLRLLARPGFSMAERVTGLSGRGVGVDAVYTRVRALGGAMNIRSVEGQGTTMVIRLPLTLAIVRALLARVGDETYAILLPTSTKRSSVAGYAAHDKGREVLLARDSASAAAIAPLRRDARLHRGERHRFEHGS